MPGELTFRLTASSNAQWPGCPSIDCECGRITVLLGANGTGKSQVLKALAKAPGTPGGTPGPRGAPPTPSAAALTAPAAGRKQVYVEGGRVVTPFRGTLNLPQILNQIESAKNWQPAQGGQRPKTPEEQYEASLTNQMSQRLTHGFQKLAVEADPHMRRSHAMMQAWQRGGMQGAPPHCDETPLDKVLRRFHLIFPEIDLKSDSANFAVSCHRGGNSYGVDALSDGERQVLAMLMDLTCCAPPDALFLIDEPELNLHPLLACRLWDVIETELPQAIFVYATHCISFAMRANVETQILLRPLGQPAQLLPDISDLDPQQAQEFLGAIPAIAIARNVVAVEGNRDSFDAVFYQWLLGDEYKVVPLGACESVCGAARGAGLWNKITLGVRIAGVVDRDYRTDAELDKLRNDGLVVLDFHEAESYLCEPALLYALSQNLGIKPGLLQAELEKNLFEFAGKHASETAFERTKRAFNYRFQLSSGKIDWGANPDRLTIEGWLATMAQSEVSKLGAMSAGTLIKLFGSEKERIEKLIATRDATELLRIVPGKEMLAEMIRLVGLRSPADCINSVSANMKPDDHPHLSGLKQQLLTAFGK